MEPIDIVYVGPNLLDREINTFKGDYFCIEEIKGNQYLIRGFDNGKPGWIDKDYLDANFVYFDDYEWIQGYDILERDGVEYGLRMRYVGYLIQSRGMSPQTISISDINWKSKHLNLKSGRECPCCAGARYDDCDTKYPIIVATNYPTNAGSLYDSIDGKHRIHKMIDQGHTEIQAYVLDYNELKQHYIDLL